MLFRSGVDPSGGADIGGGFAADAIDIGERDLNALVSGQVDTGNTSHIG